MNVLLIGNGGREHALAWKLKQSLLCDQLFIAPGNAGTAAIGQNVAIGVSDFSALGAFALAQQIELVVVGPEAPLVDGIYDHFQSDPNLQHILVFGPSKAAAQLEGSKAFAKAFMKEMGIPTAEYREFNTDELKAGLDYIDRHRLPIVLKADGLAAGKGVLICEDHNTAKTEFEAMLKGKFGAAGSTVVIESFLKGLEFSVFVVTDGESFQLLPVAKDYKRIGEGDTGLNTGGMGAVSPVPFVDAQMMEKVKNRIIAPTIEGLKKRQMVYKGFIFFGLIEVNAEPYVIEYNCRMGDPETEVVLPRLQSDLMALILSTFNGSLPEQKVSIDPRSACTVMLVSGGYPGSYEKDKVISGFEQISESLVFHAGTRLDGRQVLSDGGRVMAVTSYGPDFQTALRQSYAQLQKIRFDQMHYRRDIGFDLS